MKSTGIVRIKEDCQIQNWRDIKRKKKKESVRLKPKREEIRIEHEKLEREKRSYKEKELNGKKLNCIKIFRFVRIYTFGVKGSVGNMSNYQTLLKVWIIMEDMKLYLKKK